MEEPVADPQSPRPDWQAKLRRWWQTWIWRPAPAEEARRRRRRQAPAGGSSSADESGFEIEAGEAAAPPEPAAPPLAGTVYLIPISHLDTQWRWTVRETAATLLPRTVRENAAAFARFPAYRVNFDGAFRYRLLAEHHPQAFAELRRWVEAGRWCVAGATWDAMDVNLPGVESLVRHVLYGRRWFRRHLGHDPRDLFLPDCFGFGAQVPVVAAHCGLVGFATSKLRRFDDVRAALGVPFPLGWWEGLDGARLLAALDPGGYGEPLRVPPADDPEIREQLRRHQALLGRGVAVRFFGIGDRGGAPPPASLATLQRAVEADGPITTTTASSDETLRRLAAELPADRLPVWRGELLLRVHGTGCYTSQQGMKRWNARNERLAAAAERAAAAAAWLGGMEYPAARLREAWQRFLWHQFHDDLTGTSIPAAYRISWHDEALAASAFGGVLRGAVAAVARGLDTRAAGVPLVVFNPVPRRRHELVAARVPWRGSPGVAVIGPDGEPVPAQLEPDPAAHGGGAARGLTREATLRADFAAAAGVGGEAGTMLVRFLAELPPLGFAVFDVREQNAATAAPADPAAPALRSLPRGLESGRYQLLLDGDGNLSSLHDRMLGRELLAAPLRLELFADRSPRFPAWEVRWEDLEPGPVATVGGPAAVRALPAGPAAVALEVRRRLANSTFVETYRLAAAAESPVELTVDCRWRHRGRLLKLALNAAASARDAVYDVGVAGVPRPPASAGLYEVPAQSWADLTDESGHWGIAMLVDRPGGWDHPAKHVLRRTLVRSPSVGRRFRHQGLQDLGDHHWRLRLAGHRGDWRAGEVPALAELARHPPLPFVVEASAGPLGRAWSFLAVEGGELAALKEHEDGGEWVVRLLDPSGRGGTARVAFAAAAATDGRLLDGCEDAAAEEPPPRAGEEAAAGEPPTAGPPVAGGAARHRQAATLGAGERAGELLVVRWPFRPVTLGLRLTPPPLPLAHPRTTPLDLPLDRTVVTHQNEPCRQGLGRRRLTFPAELWPRELVVEGVLFRLAGGGASGAQALAAAGQRLRLPGEGWQELWLLLASGGGGELHTQLVLHPSRAAVPLVAPSALEPLAQEDQATGLVLGPLALWRLRAGYARTATVAWSAGHAHDARGADVACTPASLFAGRVPLHAGTDEVELPTASELLIFAATLVAGAGWAESADPRA
jgi:alpha-mannosidase